jgi:hypothetical protein
MVEAVIAESEQGPLWKLGARFVSNCSAHEESRRADRQQQSADNTGTHHRPSPAHS